MTSLVCWAALDSRRIASIYVASDSRITSSRGERLCDEAQKVFVCKKYPDILGYFGNAEQTPRVLEEWVRRLDEDDRSSQDNAWARARRLTEFLKEKLPLQDGHLYGQTTIVYVSRDGSGYSHAKFRILKVYVNSGVWDFSTVVMTEDGEQGCELDLVLVGGSGGSEVSFWRNLWERFHAWFIKNADVNGTKRRKTSRGVFSGLCSALSTGKDPLSGGAPQLAVVHQRGAAQALGVVWDGELFHEGRKLKQSEANALATRWHDRLFQLCDPATKKPCKLAAVHGSPSKGLGLNPVEAWGNRKARRRKAAEKAVEERHEARKRHRSRFTKE